MCGKQHINGHYVPKFILKCYGDGINCFNVKTNQYLTERNPASVFSKDDCYPNTIEKQLNERAECEFSQILYKHILGKDSIKINRKQLMKIKRFLLLGMLRTPETLEELGRIRRLYDVKLPTEYKHKIEQDFPSEFDYTISDEEYWIRTIKCILDDDVCSPDSIRSNPDSTYLLFSFASSLYSGYLSFWDVDDPGDEFIITDIGMTSENEVDWYRNNLQNVNKTNSLINLLKIMDDAPEQVKYQTISMILSQDFFHENFWMFPLSSKRMIVLINPYFKMMLSTPHHEMLFPPMSKFTLLDGERLFVPNKSKHMMMDRNIKDTDEYEYAPVKLKPREVQYCNALFMDRIHEWMGFTELGKIKNSVA